MAIGWVRKAYMKDTEEMYSIGVHTLLSTASSAATAWIQTTPRALRYEIQRELVHDDE